jgi:hypothetical protein
MLVKVSKNTPKNIKNKIYKLLTGTTVTIEGKRYRTKGLIKKLDGVILSPGLYIIPSEKFTDFIVSLKERNLDGYIRILKMCICPCKSEYHENFIG